MRGVSLPREPVFSLLKSDFVVGWKNIIKEKYVGESHGYSCDGIAVGTTNGAGPHNVQIFVISQDGVVLHALAGFWHPEDLARELRFALDIRKVWTDKSIDRATKNDIFSAMQLAEINNHPKKMVLRSSWQGFDGKNEVKRAAKGIDRDTFVRNADGVILTQKGRKKLKTLNVLAHERMASRPFVLFEKFDIFEFADYGRTYYDNNKKVNCVGTTLMTPRKVAKKTAKENKQLSQFFRAEVRLQKAADRAAEKRHKKARSKRGRSQKASSAFK